MTKKRSLPIVRSNVIEEGDVIAVGDIHGRKDLLDAFLKDVSGSETHIIFLGDLIDRGPNSLGVLQTVRHAVEEPDSYGLKSVTALAGNHEDLLLQAMFSRSSSLWGDPNSISLWIRNGGSIADLDEMVECHKEWVQQLPLYTYRDRTLFVHAGVRPGWPPEACTVDELIWIREPFLSQGPQLKNWTHEYTRVVHGHSIRINKKTRRPMIDVSRDGTRIGIDTGAYASGLLTTFNSTRDTFKQYRA